MLEIYEAYWTDIDVLIAFMLLLVSILAFFLFFLRSRSPRARSRSLSAMMLLSISLWLLIGLSFVVCFALSEAYEYQPEVAVRTALGISLLLAIFSGLPLSFLLRRYSPRIFLRNVKDLSPPPANLAKAFRTISRKVGVAGAELRISRMKLPISFVTDMHVPVVVISQRLLSLLKRDEVEAVMAHELAHVKNSDTALKAMVTAYKTALPHDPIMHLVEAAFHREREMIADETAVKAIGKPLSLASALLKIHKAFPRSSLRSYGPLSILGAGSGLLNRHPPITDRIEQLVRIARISQN